MDTIKIDSKATKIIAHRGLSSIECENTCAAFVAAGNRGYFGIETDMRVTADGKFAIIHDKNTLRVSGVNATVGKLPFHALSDIRLFDTSDGKRRSDLSIPSLEEYIRICRKYDKYSFLELKDYVTEKEFASVVDIIKDNGYLERTVFISFSWNNCLVIRKLLPEAKIQFLTKFWDEYLLPQLKRNRFDIDIGYSSVTEPLIDHLHKNRIEVNCWTVDKKADAEKFIEWGVDYITTNILE